MCGSKIEKEKGVEKRRGGVCECVVGQAKQNKERGSVCMCRRVGRA